MNASSHGSLSFSDITVKGSKSNRDEDSGVRHSDRKVDGIVGHDYLYSST